MADSQSRKTRKTMETKIGHNPVEEREIQDRDQVPYPQNRKQLRAAKALLRSKENTKRAQNRNQTTIRKYPRR